MVCVVLKMKKWVVFDVVVIFFLNLRYEKKFVIFVDKIFCEFGVFSLFFYWCLFYCKCFILLEYFMYLFVVRVN